MASHDERLTMTIGEVAEALGVDRSTAYALAQVDRLPVPVIRLGRRMVVGPAALERALSRLEGDEGGANA
jgi:excisionase family DNA binding protein